MNDSGKSEQERVPHFLHKTCKLGSFWTFHTEGETTALVLTRNEKAIARLATCDLRCHSCCHIV